MKRKLSTLIGGSGVLFTEGRSDRACRGCITFILHTSGLHSVEGRVVFIWYTFFFYTLLHPSSHSIPSITELRIYRDMT
jgi:hypothetical protein